MSRVMVGLSGGVDSAVAAYLLKKQGYDVAGATFRLMDEWDEARDAKAVADYLEIPHYVFDFREIFKKEVLDNFEEEYKKGKTPNPCVRCNKFIKFPAFFEKAQELGYDLISTGHYARTDGENIFRAKNLAKDQSYMMYNIEKELIPHLRFPLADLSKEEIRAIAAEAGIPVAQKPDSQDICFIPDGDTQGYLERKIGKMPCGKFVDENGKCLGEHKGICRYTIGQRKGLGLSLPAPLYVGKIDPQANEVVLVENEALLKKRLMVKDFHWINGAPEMPIPVTCKIRYAHNPAPALASTCIFDDKALILFEEPQRAVTPGQSAVIYSGDKLLGGGVIMG
ncbi:MAG: tRNA 2-thiouridine(34) synthase MnmA [Oscillospiraceae bacterium]|nr:tRNA 2-thiouridine(34) synthase MnmA [Oscillospiraceae bacterium]MBQ2862472.1 tRNA 2-thiouridine(34) synthase MnmA [Oscillospiraceae bacterium]MBQ2997946.1 tRNA 2-thiouridine(34) synthase MnmA [Oscillospiraceae bacterium]MBQ3561456.1 tRNA 2-thiouridine(34) synthase MnmA [Oscillospiraceae bacterium]